MKQSSELVTDFLSFYELLKEYLNSISSNKCYLGSNDIIFFARLMKKFLDDKEVSINIFKDIEEWQTFDVQLLLIRLQKNDLISVLPDGSIKLPDNIPFELTVS